MAPLRQPFRASQAQQTQFSGIDSQLTTDSPPRSTRGSEPKVQLCDKCDAHEGGGDAADDAHEDGKGGRHAVVLLDCAAAPKEGDKEDDTANDDEEDGGVEELVTEEVKVLGVGTLDHTAHHYQEQARKLRI